MKSQIQNYGPVVFLAILGTILSGLGVLSSPDDRAEAQAQVHNKIQQFWHSSEFQDLLSTCKKASFAEDSTIKIERIASYAVDEILPFHFEDFQHAYEHMKSCPEMLRGMQEQIRNAEEGDGT